MPFKIHLDAAGVSKLARRPSAPAWPCLRAWAEQEIIGRTQVRLMWTQMKTHRFQVEGGGKRRWKEKVLLL